MFAPELKRGLVKAVLQDQTLSAHGDLGCLSTGRRASAKARAFVAFIDEELASSDSPEECVAASPSSLAMLTSSRIA
jgi:hypothetical protein